MKKTLLLCIISLSCFCTACGSSKTDSTGSDVITTTVATTEEITTIEEQTGSPSGEIQRMFVRYEGVLYVYDTGNKRHMDESKVASRMEGYEKIGIVNIDNLNLPDEELDATRFEEGATLYAKPDHDTEVYVYSKDTLYRMVPYKNN